MSMNPTETPNPAASERESKKFWAVAEFGEVKLVTGYICEKNPGVWWVPELGFSMPEGYHLFTDEESALKKAICEQAAIASDAQERLRRLNEQMLRARQKGAR